MTVLSADTTATVVLVSDDELTRDEAAFGLPAHVRVLLAADAREALPLLEGSRPDAVVMDIRSGSAGGFSLARDMSQRVNLENVPVLMLLERAQDEWLARQAGAAATCVKPVDADRLAAAVLALLGA